MGNYLEKNKGADATKQERIFPEPTYEIKTRPPTNVGHTWRHNIQLRVREEQLADEAMPLARRKCYDPTMDYIACTQREGLFWMVFNCQEEFFYVAECQEYEFYVEMDKRRRDMQRNPQHWWRQLYDENGEIGRQKEMIFGQLGLWDSVKLTFLGEDSIKDAQYNYGKKEWFKG